MNCDPRSAFTVGFDLVEPLQRSCTRVPDARQSVLRGEVLAISTPDRGPAAEVHRLSSNRLLERILRSRRLNRYARFGGAMGVSWKGT